MIEDPFNLLEIDRGLRELESSGGQAALDLKKWRDDLARKRKQLRDAKTKATFNAPDGTVQMKSAYVDQETTELQLEYDLADNQARYGADMVDERRSTRSSLQTRAKLAVEAMKLAGYGGGA
ncbi:hypothetical protein [Nocardia sp. Marseille-Q1738]